MAVRVHYGGMGVNGQQASVFCLGIFLPSDGTQFFSGHWVQQRDWRDLQSPCRWVVGEL